MLILFPMGLLFVAMQIHYNLIIPVVWFGISLSWNTFAGEGQYEQDNGFLAYILLRSFGLLVVLAYFNFAFDALKHESTFTMVGVFPILMLIATTAYFIGIRKLEFLLTELVDESEGSSVGSENIDAKY